MKIVIQIPLIPKAQKRARSRAFKTKSGKWAAMTYKDNLQDLDEQKFIAYFYEKRLEKMIEGPIMLGICAFMPIPKSKSKRWKARAAAGGIRPTGRPDLDNLIKHVKDCLTGIFWRDDSQIVGYMPGTGKYYSESPRWQIVIEYEEE